MILLVTRNASFIMQLFRASILQSLSHEPVLTHLACCWKRDLSLNSSTGCKKKPQKNKQRCLCTNKLWFSVSLAFSFSFDKDLILSYFHIYECLGTMEDSMVGVFKCHICLCGLQELWVIGTVYSVVVTGVWVYVSTHACMRRSISWWLLFFWFFFLCLFVRFSVIAILTIVYK